MRQFHLILFVYISLISLANTKMVDTTTNTSKSKLIYIENKNQWDNAILYSAQIGAGSFGMLENGFYFNLHDADRLEDLHSSTHQTKLYENGDYYCEDEELINNHRFIVQFNSTNETNIIAEQKTEQYYNYFIGKDSSRWASRAYGYNSVRYESLYRQIDLVVYSEEFSPKYDFIVRPMGDVKDIKLTYKGVDDIYLFDSQLYIDTSLGLVIEDRPIAYQLINGVKYNVDVRFQLNCDTLSFDLPNDYNHSFDLVIDPLLIFSTYSGSTADNWGNSATPGENGTLFSAGVTNLDNNPGNEDIFPTTTGAYQTTWGGMYDVAIIKFDSIGKQMLFATYLGGEASETSHSIVMNNSGELLIFGSTSSNNFPTTNLAYDRSFNGGQNTTSTVNYENGSDIFISKLSNDGTQLLSSTFLGGSNNDGTSETLSPLSRNYGDQLRGDVITDDQNNVYVATTSSSNDFPIVRGFQTEIATANINDAVVVKLNSDLSELLWSSYIGGLGEDAAHSIQLDMDANVFVAGGTASEDFKVTQGSYNSIYNGDVDGWVTHIDLNGDSIIHSTYTGTSAYDQVYFVDLDESEEVYVYGQSQGDFLKTSGVYSNTFGRMFVQKLSNDLSTIRFSTAFGSNSNSDVNISPTAFLVSECNNLYMAGWGGLTNLNSSNYLGGNTYDMRVSEDAWQSTTSGSDFYLMVLTNDATEFLYGTYLGGNQSKTHVDGGTSRFDKHGIVYHSVCAGCVSNNQSGGPTSDFPTTEGAWSNTNNSTNCNNAAFKFDLASLRARLRANTLNFDNPGIKNICLPDKMVFENVSIGGERFVWDFGDGTTEERMDTTYIIHEYLNPGTYFVELTAIDENTCIGVDQASLIIHVFEGNFSVSENIDICLGDKIKLEAYGGTQYYWFTKDISYSSNAQFPSVDPIDTTTYFVFIENFSFGCSHIDSVKVNVIPEVKADFLINRHYDCLNVPAVEFVNNSINTTGYLWDFGDGTISNELIPEHHYDSGLFELSLSVVNGICTDKMIQTIDTRPIKTYNVFTPNSSIGLNDFFVVESPVPVHVTIVNRWGKVVYEADEYKNEWDASGEPSGVYYYDISINNKQQCKGWVQVFK